MSRPWHRRGPRTGPDPSATTGLPAHRPQPPDRGDPSDQSGRIPDPIHVLHLDRRFAFRADPDEVWRNMCRVDEFPSWWRWLRDFEVVGAGLEPGGVLSGLVVPPIPYRFHVSIHLDEVRPASAIRARLVGDLTGPAAIDLDETPTGSELTLRWDVEMRKPAMRSAAHVARPLLVWGHDQVIEITLRRFENVVEGTI